MAETYKWTKDESITKKYELEKIQKSSKTLKMKVDAKLKETGEEYDCRKEMIDDSIKHIQRLAKHFEANPNDTDKYVLVSDAYRDYVLDKANDFEE